jgi:hypothetical protein
VSNAKGGRIISCHDGLSVQDSNPGQRKAKSVVEGFTVMFRPTTLCMKQT